LNASTVWSTGDIILDNGFIQNQSSFSITANNSEMGPIPNTNNGFANMPGGTVSKTAGGLTIFQVPVSSAGNISLNGLNLSFANNCIQTGGVVDLGNNGTLNLFNSGLGVNGTYQLFGGTLKGTGNLSNVELTNSGGTVEVGGVLNLSGDYTQQAGGNFQVDASADNQANWGTLAITGWASLNGNLDVNLANGYVPVGGVNAKAYTILTAAGGVTGAFPQPVGWTESAANTSPVTLKKN
jgi:hypothetical protein